MPSKQWDVLVHRSSRRIELVHTLFTGRREIKVDGEPIEIDPSTQGRGVDLGSVHAFAIEGTPCAVVIRPNLARGFDYDLVVNGAVHPTGSAPVYPNLAARGAWWAHAIDHAPRAVASVFAAMALGWFGLAIGFGISLANRPTAPTTVALSASAPVGGDAWIELVGLSVDCAAPTFEHSGTHYRFAGRDELGRPVVVTGSVSECDENRARGEIHDARGTSASALASRFGSQTVRVLSTASGPTNDRIAIVVGSILGLCCVVLAAYAWVRRR